MRAQFFISENAVETAQAKGKLKLFEAEVLKDPAGTPGKLLHNQVRGFAGISLPGASVNNKAFWHGSLLFLLL
jgi:hypothetical protein